MSNDSKSSGKRQVTTIRIQTNMRMSDEQNSTSKYEAYVESGKGGAK